MYGGDEVSAIVVDLGSHTCKAGYAGEYSPKAVLPSVISPFKDGVVVDLDIVDNIWVHAFRERLAKSTLCYLQNHLLTLHNKEKEQYRHQTRTCGGRIYHSTAVNSFQWLCDSITDSTL